MTAQAAIFQGAEFPQAVQALPIPDLGAGEILVRVLAAAICRSDLHTAAGRRMEPTPTILGHEIIGEIVEFGQECCHLAWDGEILDIGTRVTWSIVASCGGCRYCRDGLPQKCDRMFKYGHSRVTESDTLSGGFATHVILRPGTAVFKVPTSIPDGLASLVNCSTATTAAVIRAAGHLKDRRVLIFGAGLLGLTASAMARSYGAAKVVVVEPRLSNAERARQFGAIPILPGELEDAIALHTEGRGFDVALELSGVATSAERALGSSGIGGVVVLAGTALPVGTIPLDPERVVRRMLTIRGVHNYAPCDLQSALRFLSGLAADYPFSALISETFPLDRIQDAFATAESRPGLRVVIRP